MVGRCLAGVLSNVFPLSSIVFFFFFEPTNVTAQILFVPGVLLRTTKFGGGGLAAWGERGKKMKFFVSAIIILRTVNVKPFFWWTHNLFSWSFSLAETFKTKALIVVAPQAATCDPRGLQQQGLKPSWVYPDPNSTEFENWCPRTPSWPPWSWWSWML